MTCPYNAIMVNQKLQWLLPREHPLVQFQMRKVSSQALQPVIFGSSVGLLVLFGGLGLPILYLLLSLSIGLQLVISTGDRIYSARSTHTWDLICTAPFSNHEMLIAIWSATLWRLKSTWTLFLFRLLHSLIIIGAMVFTLSFGDIPPERGLALVVGGTLLLAFQPFAVLYFSGMVSLLWTSLASDRVFGIMAASISMLICWLVWTGALLLAATSGVKEFSIPVLMTLLIVPVLFPLGAGWAAGRVAARLMV